MPNRFRLNHYILSLVTTLSIVLLASCASAPQSSLPSQMRPKAFTQHSAQSYLNKAQKQQGYKQHYNQLNATAVLLINNYNNAANQLLNDITEDELQASNQSYFYLLKTFLKLNLNQPKQALETIKSVNPSQLTHSERSVQLLYRQVAQMCYQRNHRTVASIKQRIAIAHLSKRVNKEWLQSTWLKLQRLSVKTLKQQSRHNSGYVRAWFKLALIIRQNNTHARALTRHIQQWQRQHPNHTANRLLPDNLTPQSIATYHAQKIAILLPQSGPYQSKAQAIRNGLLTALKKQNTSTDISFYDTSKGSIRAIYQKAIDQDSDLIIGPLTKPHVKKIAQRNIPVPTIALNYTTHPPESEHLLEFGLSPQQSARQSADSAWKRGANNFLMIQSPGSWFDNISRTFKQRIRSKGGSIGKQITLNKDDHKLQIAQALGVNQSQVRAHYVRNILREKPIYTPRRRQDLHGIFLVTPPPLARQINPLIKFYYAGDLPIYSTSLINDDTDQPHKDSDLDPIHFSDLRWILNSHYQTVKHSMKSNWPQSYQTHRRLYAIGFDAVNIAEHINYFNKMPSCVFPGVSGPLYAHDQKVNQQLALGRFAHGQVKFVSE